MDNTGSLRSCRWAMAESPALVEGMYWREGLPLCGHSATLIGKGRVQVPQNKLPRVTIDLNIVVSKKRWPQLSGCQVLLVFFGGCFSHLFSIQFCLLWMKLMRFPSTLLSVPVRSAANGHGHCTSCSRRRNQASISFSKSKPHHSSWISVKHRQIWSVVFHTVPAADSIQWFSFKWFCFYYFCWYLVYSLESNFHVCWSPSSGPSAYCLYPKTVSIPRPGR